MLILGNIAAIYNQMEPEDKFKISAKQAFDDALSHLRWAKKSDPIYYNKLIRENSFYRDLSKIVEADSPKKPLKEEPKKQESNKMWLGCLVAALIFWGLAVGFNQLTDFLAENHPEEALIGMCIGIPLIFWIISRFQ